LEFTKLKKWTMAHYKIRAHTTFLTLLLLSLNIITKLTAMH